MKKKWPVLIIGIVLVLAVAGLSACTPVKAELPGALSVNMESQQTGIWVSGEGKVTLTPDIATLSLGIQSQAVSVAEAQAKATDAMNKVMAALTGNDVAEKDIRTQYFNISPVYKWDDQKQEQILIGYQVTNTVAAKIRQIDKTGTIIDAVAAAGGDLTRINGISFSVDNPSAYYGEARQKAMADAKGKAEQLASLAGITLGKPVYISESTGYIPPTPVVMYKGAEAPGATSTPISPGETEITLNVQVRYAIGP